MHLSKKQKQVHDQAVYLACRHRALEAKLVETLREVECLQIHKRFGMSLFKYATQELKLSESFSYSLITVARKTKDLPELREAIRNKDLSLSKASRIVSVLSSDNANELIGFAKTHDRRTIDLEVAKRNPQSKTYDKVRPIDEGHVEIKITIQRSTLEKLKRVESLEARKQRNIKLADVLDSALEVYLEKKDPVRKAQRMSKKLWHARVGSKNETRQNELSTKSNDAPKRIPLTAEQKHAVFLRDKGVCTHKDVKGRICSSDKFIEIHHIVPVANGGTNERSNLTTLCSFHHDLAHQLSLPLEGQVTWLRSPIRKYG